MSYLPLGPWQVGCATLLILLNGGISVALRLGLERSLLVASLRTIAQLWLIGMILNSVFRLQHSAVVVGILLVMTGIAGWTAMQRNKRRYAGMWVDTLLSVWVSSWFVTGYALATVFRDLPHWYQPRYVIPLLGMVLGNALNGISLGLSSFTESAAKRQDEIETRLALGASRWEAGAELVRDAVRAGMTPMINSMSVVGIVSLPGMMTGQLLSGTSPSEAVKYQIVIMFLIAAATAAGSTGVVLLCFRRLFNARHQFLRSKLALPQRR